MTEQPTEYIITEDEWQSLKALHLDLATNGSESDAWLIMENIHSRPVSTPPVPDSTRLIEMAKRAHTEWKNREERRGIHNEIDWCCGWMAGFLSVDKPDWVKAQAQAASEEVLVFIRSFVLDNPLDGSCPFDKMNSEECLNKRDGQCEICVIDHAIESFRQPKKEVPE